MPASPQPPSGGPGTSNPSDPAARRPHVAVVAVHGIGDHEAGASARSIAQLLLRVRQRNRADENRYTSFRSVGLDIPVKKAYVSTGTHAGSRNWMARLRARFQERSDSVDVLRAKVRHGKGTEAEMLRGTD